MPITHQKLTGLFLEPVLDAMELLVRFQLTPELFSTIAHQLRRVPFDSVPTALQDAHGWVLRCLVDVEKNELDEARADELKESIAHLVRLMAWHNVK